MKAPHRFIEYETNSLGIYVCTRDLIHLGMRA